MERHPKLTGFNSNMLFLFLRAVVNGIKAYAEDYMVRHSMTNERSNGFKGPRLG
jgi:hypothetical protein